MHITPGLSLPQEWLTILDSSTRGAVYFSLGVMQGAEQLPTSVLQTLADVFGELPYTVLWKTDNTTKINKPDNVYTNSWFPQQQVLAHRNVKAFITHGGARSLEEAVFYAVPIVGLPLVKSRRIFINEITRHGAGEILDPHNFDKETVKTTINVVVTNEKYKKSMTRLKEAVVDPHVSGPEKAIWWTEYLLRNGNARHLRSPAVGISFIQYYFLDIVFIVLMIVLLSLYLALMIERALVRGWRSGFWRRRGLGCPASTPLLIGNRPSVPAVVYVDRMHITPGLSLPQEWLTILDSSTRGAVYFSLGVMQGAEQLPTSVLQTLADVFGELPYTVLWKTDNTTKINKPDNVYTNSWFPQQQVLAHRNIKAFITHGGARSLEEAVFYAVPIVGLPLVKSRRVFINEITRHGAGEILDPHSFDKETVKTTINVVVTNEKYKKSMTRLKEAVVDPHVSGPEKAIWWTEYLLRNGNARHLRSPAVGISFIQYYFLDIVFIVLMILLLSLYLALMIERALVRGWRSGFWRRRSLGCPGKFKAL
ncbi:hypothetical protein PYW07_007922 [Mythimna separata]|uniref:UDP-glucuronosyltransferase n=1 Tax=Mythimna separata TaxID=271217 RepID=A0AAD7YQJ7_MYTSE|nr:hypothetical protein PYW07_007922 [Mythimna separata]